jgi:hypothetical protein
LDYESRKDYGYSFINIPLVPVPDTGTSDWIKKIGNSIHDNFQLHSFRYVGLEKGPRLHNLVGSGGQTLLNQWSTHDKYILLTDDRAFLVGGCIWEYEAQSIDKYMTSFLSFPLPFFGHAALEFLSALPRGKIFFVSKIIGQIP